MENISEIIQIHSIEASPYGVKINATDKRVFNVSKTKQDGTTTVAWQQMVNMGLKGLDALTNTPGSIVEIWFREVPNKHGGISRYISSFKESGNRSVGKLGESSAPVENSRPGASSSVTESPKDETFWDKKAYKQCLWNYWLEKDAPDLQRAGENTLSQIQMDIVWAVFNQIEQDAEKRFNPSKFRQAVQRTAPKVVEPELPVIQQDEDMPDVEGIPF